MDVRPVQTNIQRRRDLPIRRWFDLRTLVWGHFCAQGFRSAFDLLGIDVEASQLFVQRAACILRCWHAGVPAVSALAGLAVERWWRRR